MKILHCCLAAFYIDDFGYQENILPKMHLRQGHDVKIIASTETYVERNKLGYIAPGTYMTREGIPITRIPYQSWLPHVIMKKLRLYRKLIKGIKDFSPDIIFLHDCQFISIVSVAQYLKANVNTKLYVDSHTDFINSGRGWVSKNILHRVVYRFCAKLIENRAEKFFGTLPIRSDFLHEVYGINPEKIALLPFGADDSLFNWNDRTMIRNRLRTELKISEDTFVIITGGKIDNRKNIHYLLEAFKDVCDESNNRHIKLIVFGKPVEDLKETIEKASLHRDIIYIEWLPSEEIHKYFFAADLGIFPGTHSVLWEEAVGMGLPCVFQKWRGITHISLNGNCQFLDDGRNVNEIINIIKVILDDPESYIKMLEIAQREGPKRFSYSQIAIQAIS